jgi:hypothetical protein
MQFVRSLIVTSRVPLGGMMVHLTQGYVASLPDQLID